MDTRKKALSWLIGCCMAMPVFADSFGPDEWTQYRMNAANNAVYNNGGELLNRMKFRTGDQVRATPVVVGDALYIGNHATGGMFRFDLPNGKVAWHDDNPWFRHAPNWIHSEMIQAGGRIFVGYGNRVFQSPDIRGTGASGVMVVDPEDGATLWQYETLGEVMPTPAFWNDTLYAVTGGAELIALAPGNGKLLWRDLLGSGPRQSNNTSGAPAITAGKVFFGDTAGLLHALDAEDGDTPHCDSGRATDTLKLGGSSHNSPAIALAPAGPVVINRTVFVGSQDGFVYAVPLSEFDCR
ncbi:MAG: PQQ-binding-like beta-propeller repeat protein [Marinobacter sp.]|uniref:PQQ-binding-like beta-propeller repeat protein n=1 Tax=Marinobacter sp. TaxID=50741 RepID=UPI003F9B04B6